MNEIEQKYENLGGFSLSSFSGSHKSNITIEVACDDCQTELEVHGNDTIAQVRHRALSEMQILATDPNKYVVIGPDRQPIRDQCTVDEILESFIRPCKSLFYM